MFYKMSPAVVREVLRRVVAVLVIFVPDFTFQSAAKESSSEERLTPVVLAQQAAQLKQQLVSAHLDSLLGPQAHINLADPDGALAR